MPLAATWICLTNYSNRYVDLWVFHFPSLHFFGFFPCANRIWNSLSAKRFPLTYDLYGYKHRDIFFIWALSKLFFYALFILILFFLQIHTSMLNIEIWWKLHVIIPGAWDNRTWTTRVEGRSTNHYTKFIKSNCKCLFNNSVRVSFIINV